MRADIVAMQRERRMRPDAKKTAVIDDDALAYFDTTKRALIAASH
jgi:hypothetical protein